MSNRFTQSAVAAFLTEQGCNATRATFISNFVVSALRSVSVHAEIADQSANEDFTAYRVSVAANGGEGFTVAYTANKLGAGFYDHRAKVTTPEAEYTVTRLVHEPAAVSITVSDDSDAVTVEAAGDVTVQAENVAIEAPDTQSLAFIEPNVGAAAEVEAEAVAHVAANIAETIDAEVLAEVEKEAESFVEAVVEETVPTIGVFPAVAEVDETPAPEAEAPKPKKAKKAKAE